METRMNCPNCEKLERELLSALAAIERLSSASFVDVSENIAKMVTDYVENGIKLGTDWRNGLSGIISKRLKRLQVGDDIKIDLSALREHDAELLNDVVRLLASIFLSNGKSLLGGSPPVAWSPRGIAQRATENINKHDVEVREPLVKALNLLLDSVDYLAGNCYVNSMVGAVLDAVVIRQCRDALVPLGGMKEGK